MRILCSHAAVDIVAEAADGVEAVEKSIATKPDIVVTDLSMPRMSGLKAVRRIRQALPKCRILVLTVHHDEEYIVPIVEAGASGYLVKDSASGELLDAVDALVNGGVYFGSEATKVLADRLREPGRASSDPYGNLTSRERDVFHLVAESRSSGEIAATLGISVKTASNHRSRLMRKLGLHSAADVKAYAERHALSPRARSRPRGQRRRDIQGNR